MLSPSPDSTGWPEEDPNCKREKILRLKRLVLENIDSTLTRSSGLIVSATISNPYIDETGLAVRM